MLTAKIIAHSKSSITGQEIITFELNYPRFIHSELMTHRVFSRNAASSRAIPIDKMLEMIETNPAMPEVWGTNQPGMQAGAEIQCPLAAKVQWQLSAKVAVQEARKLQAMGLHKQIVNRIVEPFAWMKVVVTATEWDNWFWLRNHKDAQPEIRILAEKMWEELQQSEAETLAPGEWHTPYVTHVRHRNVLFYSIDCEADDSGILYWKPISLEDALKVSASMCAQVSFRKNDDSLEKAIAIYDRLVTSTPVHASPFEHAGTPMEMVSGLKIQKVFEVEEGVTHREVNELFGDAWSGNFKHWIQYRQLIPNNVCKEYKEEK